MLYAVKKDLLAEAKAAVEAYARHQPQNPDDRYRMEILITDAYLRAKDYASMATHAEQMLKAAKAFIGDEQRRSLQARRDVAEVGRAAVRRLPENPIRRDLALETLD